MHASSLEVVHVDGPFVARENRGGDVSWRGSPRKTLVVEAAREVDDDVCVVDAVGIG